MKFLLILASANIAFVAANNSADYASTSQTLTEKEKDAEIHAAVKAIIVQINSHLNDTEDVQVALSKRQYYSYGGGYGGYPYSGYMNQYYTHAYSIVRRGCYNRPRFWKRFADTQNAQEVIGIQKQLGVAWDDLIKNQNTLYPRGIPLADDAAQIAGKFFQAAKDKTDDAINAGTVQPDSNTGVTGASDDISVETVKSGFSPKQVDDDAETFLGGDKNTGPDDAETFFSGDKNTGPDASKDQIKDADTAVTPTRMQKFRQTALWITGSAIIFFILFKLMFGRNPPHQQDYRGQFTGVDGIPHEYLDADTEITFG
jgi:hypothetical protein